MSPPRLSTENWRLCCGVVSSYCTYYTQYRRRQHRGARGRSSGCITPPWALYSVQHRVRLRTLTVLHFSHAQLKEINNFSWFGGAAPPHSITDLSKLIRRHLACIEGQRWASVHRANQTPVSCYNMYVSALISKLLSEVIKSIAKQ